MNLAVMMWTLAAGGVTLPSLEPPTAQPNAPIYQPPATGFGLPQASSPGSPTRAPFLSPPPGRRSSWQNRGGSPLPRVGSLQPMIPLAPTDRSAASETFPWGPPTAYSGPEAGGLGGPPTLGAPASPYAGTRPPGTVPYGRPALPRPGSRGYSSSNQQPRPRTSDAFERAASRMPQRGTTKPYSDYRPARGTSPYMQLYRRDQSVGIDNYNQYVRPALERQKARQQMNRDIRSLQGTSRRQGAAIQNLGRQSRALQGNAVSRYYQNYGNYYPGLAR